MRRTFKLATAFVLVMVSLVALLAGYLGILPFTGVSPTSAKLGNPGYLSLKSGNFVINTKLFLVSAFAAYGTHEGQECFIINATLRNDYQPNEGPEPQSKNTPGIAVFVVSATLFNPFGQIGGVDITSPDPPFGKPQHSVYSGENASVLIFMQTPFHNINSYSINLFALSGGPTP